jgi:hypothetical protein
VELGKFPTLPPIKASLAETRYYRVGDNKGSLRGAKPPLIKKISPSPLKERGIKGVR